MPFLAQEHVDIPERNLVSWVFDGPKYDENVPIYVDAQDPSRSLTKSQALAIVRKLVAGFHAAGLEKGDVVVLASNNDIMYSMIFLGVVAAGGVISCANPNYQYLELAHQLKVTEARLVLAEPTLLDTVSKVASDLKIPSSSIFSFEPKSSAPSHGFQSWQTLLQHGHEDWHDFLDPRRSHETAALLFSSGTTGLPKAAQITHHNLIAQHTLVYEASRSVHPARRLIALPMFHVAMAPVSHTSPLRAGTPTYVLPRFDTESFLRGMEEHEITELLVVPPMINMILASPLSKKYSLKAVKKATSGAAPLKEGPQAKMQALLSPNAPLTQVWGMTETTCVFMRFEYPEADTTASVGRPLPNMDVKLVDDSGKDITDYGVRGELCVRGPIVVKGYLKNENKDFDDEGYFHTGDVCVCDKKTKKWYIVDRKKELIKVRGFQVAPPELEGVLLSHPDIVDAAVVGVPGREDGEFPRAYLIKREGANLTEGDVRKYMAERLIYYKRLDGGVVFTNEIPKNASGKILKRLLREQAAREMGAKL